MPPKPLVVSQSNINGLTKAAHKLNAGVFRSTGLFKNFKRTRQLMIAPVLEQDYNVLLEEVKKIFPANRIYVKNWRAIRINLEDVTFSPG